MKWAKTDNCNPHRTKVGEDNEDGLDGQESEATPRDRNLLPPLPIAALLHDGCQMAKFTYAAIRGAAFMQYPKRSQYKHAKKKKYRIRNWRAYTEGVIPLGWRFMRRFSSLEVVLCHKVVDRRDINFRGNGHRSLPTCRLTGSFAALRSSWRLQNSNAFPIA